MILLNMYFLPYHKMGEEKYKKLDIDYLYKDLPAMDKSKCDELHDYFNKLFFEKDN